MVAWMLLVIVGVGGLILWRVINHFDMAERYENNSVLTLAIQKLRADPTNARRGVEFLRAITGLRFTNVSMWRANVEAFAVLKLDVAAPDIQNAFLAYLQSAEWTKDLTMRSRAYKAMLELLMTNSDPRIKQFMLQVARWHYGRMRTNGVLTIYDEQAIQNDLSSHTRE